MAKKRACKEYLHFAKIEKKRKYDIPTPLLHKNKPKTYCCEDCTICIFKNNCNAPFK